MKITDVTVTLFRWEGIPPTTYNRHTGTFGGDTEMGLVTIQTDEGLEGHAFLGSALNGAHADGPDLLRYLKPLLMDQNPLDRERLYDDLSHRNRMVAWRTIGAADIALWDLAGKAAGLPVHQLIGTYRHSVPAYASSAVLPSKEAYAEEAVKIKEAGWAAYKIHPPTRWEEDIQVCRAVREAVGDDYPVMLDSTWSYSFHQAIRVGRAIEELGFYWYEDPLADDDIYNCVKLAGETRYPAYGDGVFPGRFHRLRPVDHDGSDRLPPGGRGGQGWNHRNPQDRAPRGGVRHELRGAPWRQLPQQLGQPARHRGDPEYPVLRSAPAG